MGSFVGNHRTFLGILECLVQVTICKFHEMSWKKAASTTGGDVMTCIPSATHSSLGQRWRLWPWLRVAWSFSLLSPCKSDYD